MSKPTPRKAVARAAGARDSRNPADPAPAPDAIPAPEAAPTPEAALARDDASAPPPALDPPPPAALDDVDDWAPRPIDYDPADYRWVPVRRQPRLDGWTEEKQRRFIETLADTGLVGAAARAVSMSRESAYRLRRAPHGAAFARAWDAARHHAGGLVEDIAFERAIEGTEREVLNQAGEVIATRLVHDNRLLKWLLSHLKAERYGGARASAVRHQAVRHQAARHQAAAPDETPEAVPALEDHLRAMEPALPAPPEELLDAETLAEGLEIAEAADGFLPHFFMEQRPPVSAARQAVQAAKARSARGADAWNKQKQGEALSKQEFADMCFHIDPVSNARPRPRRRQGSEGPPMAPPGRTDLYGAYDSLKDGR